MLYLRQNKPLRVKGDGNKNAESSITFACGRVHDKLRIIERNNFV